jgi:hypothetical protein
MPENTAMSLRSILREARLPEGARAARITDFREVPRPPGRGMGDSRWTLLRPKFE